MAKIKVISDRCPLVSQVFTSKWKRMVSTSHCCDLPVVITIIVNLCFSVSISFWCWRPLVIMISQIMYHKIVLQWNCLRELEMLVLGSSHFQNLRVHVRKCACTGPQFQFQNFRGLNLKLRGPLCTTHMSVKPWSLIHVCFQISFVFIFTLITGGITMKPRSVWNAPKETWLTQQTRIATSNKSQLPDQI